MKQQPLTWQASVPQEEQTQNYFTFVSKFGTFISILYLPSSDCHLHFIVQSEKIPYWRISHLIFVLFSHNLLEDKQVKYQHNRPTTITPFSQTYEVSGVGYLFCYTDTLTFKPLVDKILKEKEQTSLIYNFRFSFIRASTYIFK